MMNWLIQRAQAATSFNGDFDFLKIRDNETSAQALANSIINWVLGIAGILAVIYLIIAGITYITAGGNPDAAKKGQQGIINAIIGIVVIGLAYVIAQTAASLIK